MQRTISSDFPFDLKRTRVHDAEMAYVDVGTGDPIVFLHGNPTSSYTWRNVIPHAQSLGRCLAPDLIGMGASSPSPMYSYKFADHAHYLDAWFEQLGLHKNIILVVQDWGAALGFDRVVRYPESVSGIVYMEAMVRPRLWTDMSPERQAMFKRIRSAEGEKLCLENNFFVEKMLFEYGVIRKLTSVEKEAYLKPYREPGVSRLPTLVWPRQIPFDGDPPDTYVRVKRYSDWLSQSAHLPKLFINAEEGHGTAGAARDFCRAWPNQREISLRAKHYLPEDCPHEIGEAVAQFVTAVRGATANGAKAS
jgi:haloalkane dehalogenase